MLVTSDRAVSSDGRAVRHNTASQLPGWHDMKSAVARSSRWCAALGAALCCTSVTSPAQGSNSLRRGTTDSTVSVSAQSVNVDHLSSRMLDSAARHAARNEARGVSFRTSADNTVQYILNHRSSASAIELHCAWDDLILVRSGAGTLRHSRKIAGLEKYTAWEWRGTRLVTPRAVPLGPGDVVRVPAGEGHEISRLGDAPLVYLVVKVRTVVPTPCGSLPERGR